MATIVLRNTKGSALTIAEADANINNLNTDKLEDITSQSIGDLSDVNISGATDGQILTYSSGTSQFTAQSPATSELVDDASPQLGGNLDGQDNIISAIGLKDYLEPVYSLGSTDSPTISVSNGNVQSVTITSGLSLPAFSDASAGQSVTLIVSGSGSASGTGAYKFAGGNKTLTTESVVSIFYDGTTYYTSIATDFQA